MARQFASHRVDHQHLSLIQGGVRGPAERIASRVAEKRKLVALISAALAAVILALVVTVGLIGWMCFQFGSAAHFAEPCLSVGAGLMALGTGLIVTALRRL